MKYAIYDKKKKKFPYTDDEPYTSQKDAKMDIIEQIHNWFNDDDNKAIYILDNLVVKEAPLGFGKKKPVKKTPAKPVTTPVSRKAGSPLPKRPKKK